MIQFSPVIDLGTVLQVAAFVGTVVVAYSRFVSRIARLEAKVNLMWSAMARKLGVSFEDDEKFFG